MTGKSPELPASESNVRSVRFPMAARALRTSTTAPASAGPMAVGTFDAGSTSVHAKAQARIYNAIANQRMGANDGLPRSRSDCL